MVPYTGSIRPLVADFAPGYARVAMRDRRAVRNHLRSIHAIALANLGEVTTGLALVSALPDTVRGIPVALSITFHKKARGRLHAECRCTVPQVTDDVEVDVEAHLYDEEGEEVATVTARWRVGPIPTERHQ